MLNDFNKKYAEYTIGDYFLIDSVKLIDKSMKSEI